MRKKGGAHLEGAGQGEDATAPKPGLLSRVHAWSAESRPGGSHLWCQRRIATASSLLILPAVYAIFERGGMTGSVSLDPDDPKSRHFDPADVTVSQS